MNIRWGIWATDAHFDAEEGSLSIWKAFWSVSFPEFPVEAANFLVVVNSEVNAAEYGQTKQVEFQLIDVDGQRVFSQEGEWEVPETLGHTRFTWNFLLELEGVRIERPGEYELVILIGGEPKLELPLMVELDEEQENEEE